MISILKKILPRWLKKRIYRRVVAAYKENNRNKLGELPPFSLQKKHISNTRLLEDRIALLHLLPKNGIVAELGVDQGDFSKEILKICAPRKLHLVDLWNSKRYNQEKRRSVEKRFEQEVDNGQVTINIGLSTEVVRDFPDNYFDWIYIDTDHSYKTTAAELASYLPKMKEGGIICGHDYIVGNWDGMVKYGVIEAVTEFCNKQKWEIQYLTTENNIFPSFALKKPQSFSNKQINE